VGIEGNWYNAFGSSMTIGPVRDGAFTFQYETAVSSAGCAKGVFAGTGYYAESGGAIGFSALWQNAQSQCDSVTTWCGQYRTADTIEEIVAIWLLTAQTVDPWAPTSIGEDRFVRAPVASIRSGRAPHA
jgi:hypothetical protein